MCAVSCKCCRTCWDVGEYTPGVHRTSPMKVRTCGPSGTGAHLFHGTAHLFHGTEQNRADKTLKRKYFTAHNMLSCLTLTAKQIVGHNTPSQCMRHWCTVRHAGLVQNRPCRRGRGEKQCGEIEAKKNAEPLSESV